ncbi:MAG: ABC transporter permease [Lachnospiraceae bacterium]|nr:ABC transporter permease [Lachnospiraceae bacterium]
MKIRFNGLREVFSFTLRETFKDKRYRSSFIGMIVMLILMPVISNVSGLAGANAASSSFEVSVDADGLAAERVLICNETDIPVTAEDLKENALLGTLPLVFLTPEEKDAALSGLTDKEVLLVASRNDSGPLPVYEISGIVSDESDITANEQESLRDSFAEDYSVLRYESLNLSKAAIGGITGGVSVASPISEEKYRVGELGVTSDELFGTAMLFSVALMILVSLSTSFIISSLVEEKSSRLVDMLITSVDPLSLVLGKILAMMCYVFAVLIFGGGGAMISSKVVSAIMGRTGTGVNVSEIFDFSLIMKPVNLVIIVLAFVLAYMLYAVAAGIAGSACSNPEDSQHALSPIMFLSMGGYILAILAPTITDQTACIALSLVPFLSTYIAPVMFMGGRIALPVFLLFFLINVATLLFLSLICARTYRRLAMNDGARVPLKTIFRMAFPKKEKEAAHV